MPPMMKKKNDTTRYMIPFFLWSTVVSQEDQPPGSSIGLAAAAFPTGRCMVAIDPSRSLLFGRLIDGYRLTLQERDNVVDILIRDHTFFDHRAHNVIRLDAAGV